MSSATWAYHLSVLRTKLQDTDTDPANQYWPDADMMEIANRIVNEIARRTHWYRRSTTAPGVVGQAIYTLPTDCWELNALRYGNRRLVKRNSDWMDARISTGWQDLTGEPIYFLRDELGEDEIRIYPAPATVVSSTVANNDLNALTSPITFNITTGDGANFPQSGQFYVTVGSEVMLCTSITDDALTVTRGAQGTTIALHANTPTVTLNPIAYAYTALPTPVTNNAGLIHLPMEGDTLFYYGVLREAYSKEIDRQNQTLFAQNLALFEEGIKVFEGRRAQDVEPDYVSVSIPIGML